MNGIHGSLLALAGLAACGGGGSSDNGGGDPTQPRLAISTNQLAFVAQEGGEDPAARVVEVTNTGGGILRQPSLEIRYEGPQGWLATELTGDESPYFISVAASVTEMPPGQYRAAIDVDSPEANASPQAIQVTLEIVTGSSPFLSVSGGPFNFSAIEGGANPEPQSFTISNTGSGSLAWTVSGDASWLRLSPTSGASTGEPDSVTLTADVQGIAPGTYSANLLVEAPAAPNAPQEVQVDLTVLQRNTPLIVIGGGPFNFEAAAAGPNPPPQFMTIANGGTGALNWSVSDDAPWLTLTPSSGSITGSPSLVTLTADTSGLSSGTYQASIIVSGVGASNSPQVVPATLNVRQPLSFSPTTFFRRTRAGVDSPSYVSLSGYDINGDRASDLMFDDDGLFSFFRGIASTPIVSGRLTPQGTTRFVRSNYVAVDVKGAVDVDGDGQQELVVTFTDHTNQTSHYRVFSAPGLVHEFTSPNYSNGLYITLADVNGDSSHEILVNSYSGGSSGYNILIEAINGSAGYTAFFSRSYSNAVSPTSHVMRAYDKDGDQISDIALTDGSVFRFYSGLSATPSGSFSIPWSGSGTILQEWSHSLVGRRVSPDVMGAVDVDGDGQLEVIAAYRRFGGGSYFQVLSAGNLTPEFTSTAFGDSVFLQTADVNRDGAHEIFVNSSQQTAGGLTDAQLKILNGANGYSPIFDLSYSGANFLPTVSGRDADGDGVADIFHDDGSHYRIYSGIGAIPMGSISKPGFGRDWFNVVESNQVSVDVSGAVDIDGDGQREIVITYRKTTPPESAFFRVYTTGTYVLEYTSPDYGASFLDTELADIDGDGVYEVLIRSATRNGLTYDIEVSGLRHR